MSSTATIPVGVVVERRKIDNPWQEHMWAAIGVLPGAPDGQPWKQLMAGEDRTQFLAGTFPLELHRKETAAYKYNLESRRPAVYVVLRQTEDAEQPLAVALVTASPYEAEAYMESGDEIVEAITMPESVLAWVQAFIDEHHVEEVFRKRKRDEVDIEEHKFGQEPIAVLRRRMTSTSDD